jgi:mannose-6-phosphate isomerase-like protein (cupin superfamily)
LSVSNLKSFVGKISMYGREYDRRMCPLHFNECESSYGLIPDTAEFQGMEIFHELDKILSGLEKDQYFAGFLNTESIEAGIIRLQKDQIDTQTSHPFDELYYVIRGEGYIRVDQKCQRIQQGAIVFIPATINHNFYGNKENLVVLYVLAKYS